MDYLKVRELYHSQAKGAKWGVLRWTREQGKSTLNDAGFLRQYGHPRGVPKGTKLHAVRPDEFDDFIKDLSERNKKEEPNYAKLFAEAKAKKNYEDFIKEQNDPNKKGWDDMKEAINNYKTSEEYEKFRRKYQPTNVEQTADLLKGLSEASAQLGNVMPKDEGRKVYGSYPNMTTAELNDRITRLSRERTYSDLVGDTQIIKSGKTKFREALQTVGAIAGAGAAIATVIAGLKAKKTIGG